MIEKALTGSRGYALWLAFLLALVVLGFLCYLRQYTVGLGVTGMSRDVSWGLYIAQFTFLVGIAASAVVLVLPCYLHDYKTFGKIAVLGEFLAVTAVLMCGAFIFVNLGYPSRVLFVLLHAQPLSVLFWDMIVLAVYLLLNVITGWTVLESDRKGIPAPRGIRPLILLSIPWALAIHTVTAFIYAGLPGRSFWLTAILAPKFLTAAFASGSALLVLICLLLRRTGAFDAGGKAISTLAVIAAYALATTVFFVLVEVFTVFYSAIPELMDPYRYLFVGLEGRSGLVPWMWTATILALAALVILAVPSFRRQEPLLVLACVAVFLSLWIEKGLALVVAGFTPSPLGRVAGYVPTAFELGVSLGIWAMGLMIFSVLCRVFVVVRKGEERTDNV
jgi:molybdopterin-containing oxidoreductase family membrane subunit